MGTQAHEVAQPIDGRLEQHDRDHFEVKLDYTIDQSRDVNRYEVEAYFFLPQSLGLDAQSYPKEQFYRDVQAYIRLKTPALSLENLANADGAASPLGRVASLLGSPRPGELRAERQARLSRELRLVGCLVRANLRDRVFDLCRRIREREGRGSGDLAELLRTDVARLVREARSVLAKYRLLRGSFTPPKVKPNLIETYGLVDEYLSLTFEGHLTQLLQAVDESAGRRSLGVEVERLTAAIVDERAHRKSAGYESLLDPDSGNEVLVHRLGLLKKFVTSVLFLEIARDREGRGTTHFVAAVAAGVAMLLATMASIAAQAAYQLNTFPFVVALIVAYIAKDRVKEWAKGYLSSKVAPWLADYRVKIFDPVSEREVGSCRERVELCSRRELPAEVFSARHGKRLHTIEAQSKRETVVHYQKQITIRGRDFGALDGQADEINDIIRFNVSHFSTRMDDPVRRMLTYDEGLGRVREVECDKVYHVNVVFVLRAPGSESVPRIEHARVILDKRGIRRLTSNGSASLRPLMVRSPLRDSGARLRDALPPTADIESPNGDATAVEVDA